MQDCLSDLLHLGDLAFPEDTSTEHHDLRVPCTVQRLFAEEDRMILSQLAPSEVQEWCVSRITEHQRHNRLLREWYGAAARNAISKTKSHVRALRSAYNDAAPINQYLPPEVLMEVFSYVHPAAVMPRPRVPVLRICRYWRQLIFRTPLFWANLLSLPSWKSWNPKYHMGRFRAALARSAPESLTLSVPYSDKDIADILAPHASRVSSFKVGPTLYNVKEMAQVLQQHMPRLTHLAILCRYWYGETPTLRLSFPISPNIHILELQRTNFYAPVAPCSSLCHLKLKHCAIRPSPMVGSVPALCTVHNALEFFPNLETLSMTYSLSDDRYGYLRAPSELAKTVHLLRLRHLEIEDTPAYIPLFLSHLVFPSTTSLVLKPVYRGDCSRWPTAVPLFPAINASPAPNAELSLSLDFSPRACEYDNLVHWETRGDGVGPVRVTLAGAASQPAVVSRFTRQLVDALAPAPAPGVTSLAVERPYSNPREYWEQLLPDLPGLRRLACDSLWTTKHLAGILGERMPGGEFPCARLEDLALAWNLPCTVDFGQPEGGGERQSLEHDGCGPGCHESELAAPLREFCNMLGGCLAARAGRCEPIRKLSVTLHRQYSSEDVVLEGGQVALVELLLRRGLGHLVGEVAIAGERN